MAEAYLKAWQVKIGDVIDLTELVEDPIQDQARITEIVTQESGRLSFTLDDRFSTIVDHDQDIGIIEFAN